MNTKLIEILASFSEHDWKNFEKFISQNDKYLSRNYLPLLREIKELRSNGFELRNTDAVKLFQSAYGKNDLKYQTIKNRQSELLKLCKMFLVESSFKKNSLLTDVLYSSDLLSRHLFKNYNYFLHKKNKLTVKYMFNEDSYKYMKELTLDEAAYYQLTKEESSKIIDAYKNYSDYILAETLNNLIKTGTELLMQKRIFHEQSKTDYIIEILNNLDSSGFLKKLELANNKLFLLPLIQFYIFESESLPNDKEYIRSAERIYFDNEHLFPDEFKMKIYRKLMSYYTNKINRGENEYRINIYKLIRRKLKQRLTEDLQRSAGYNVFREYIINGIQLKKYGWVEKLISDYSYLLPKNIKEIAVSTSLMRLAFARCDYNKVLSFTQDKKNIDLIYYIDVMLYKLMALYELGRHDEAFVEINKLKRHLKSQTDIYGALDKVKIFLKTYRKLLNNTVKADSDRKYFLYQVEKEKNSYMLKDWIIEKAQELVKDT